MLYNNFMSKVITFEELIEGEIKESPERAYDRIYVKHNLQHTCDFEWYRDFIYPYTIGGKNPND